MKWMHVQEHSMGESNTVKLGEKEKRGWAFSSVLHYLNMVMPWGEPTEMVVRASNSKS